MSRLALIGMIIFQHQKSATQNQKSGVHRILPRNEVIKNLAVSHFNMKQKNY